MNFPIFPTLEATLYEHVDLNEEAWKRMGNTKEASPYLGARACQKMVDEVHQERGLDWSYGGYGEIRKDLWKGSPLLVERNRFRHVGIDYNARAGTPIAASRLAIVRFIDRTRESHEDRWGGRIILDLVDDTVEDDDGISLLYAHLSADIRGKIDETLRPEDGKYIGFVGLPTENGDWYEHVHVQVIVRKHLNALLQEDRHLRNLMGYVHLNERKKMRQLYPDPTPYIDLPTKKTRFAC